VNTSDNVQPVACTPELADVFAPCARETEGSTRLVVYPESRPGQSVQARLQCSEQCSETNRAPCRQVVDPAAAHGITAIGCMCTVEQQIDLQTAVCDCLFCESRASVNEVHVTMDLKGPAFEDILTTGWPLSVITSTTDQQTLQCFRIYDSVRASGVPNFLSARLSLPHALNIPKWRWYLHNYEDISLVDFLDYGFPVGFDAQCPLSPTYNNHSSATSYPDHVQFYLDTECQAGAMLGPFTAPPFWPWLHISPLMTRDKKHSTHRRAIVDLSWPHEASVNGGTPLETYLSEPYKLHLPTAEDLAVVIAHFGPGCGLWARDLRRAYRQWRIDPLDWPLMGIKVEGLFYLDTAVAFGAPPWGGVRPTSIAGSLRYFRT
jgi:hypothetical protein